MRHSSVAMLLTIRYNEQHASSMIGHLLVMLEGTTRASQAFADSYKVGKLIVLAQLQAWLKLE